MPDSGWRATGAGLAAGMRLLRATAALGRPAPLPVDLLGLGARLSARGLLNAGFLATHPDWLVPAWMRAQSDPAAPGFRPTAHGLVDINLSARNWTAIGTPGSVAEAIVDPRGLVTAMPEGPSLDCWVQPAGGPLLAAATQPAPAIRQRMQGRLPVVATAFEAGTVRLATEAWVCRLGDAPAAGEWVAMQAVVFNLSDDAARGHFYFALRPFNAEGVAPIQRLAYRRGAFLVDGALAAVLLPAPAAWDCDPGTGADLATRVPALAGRSHAAHPAGLCHGVAAYAYAIAPWEEAEFLAFLPLGRGVRGQGSGVRGQGSVVSKRGIWQGAGGRGPQSYALLKGVATRGWQAKLDGGVRLWVPDARLEESWTVNVGHLLVLHDGHSITPGPATYHRFWMRDAAYMLAALATAGQGVAAWQVLASYPARQGRDGRFAAPPGQGDATGQALWTVDRVARLAPDAGALADLWPTVRRGAGWITRARRGSRPTAARGLLPAGRAADHLGPPDYYYWDNFWALAGLEAAARIATRLGHPGEATAWAGDAARLRAALDRSLAASLTAEGAIPAAPGRRADSGMIGSLVAWAPLGLYPADDPQLGATLRALQAISSHEGVFFQQIVHQGWGTYLNMRIAGCLLRRRDPAAFGLVTWLLNHATPTYTWPEAIHPQTGGGCMGDGMHGWASAQWLLLLRDLLVFEEGARLVLLAGLPAAWLAHPGALALTDAPTLHGRVSLDAAWESGGPLRLDLAAASPPPGGYELCLPQPAATVQVDGAPLPGPGRGAPLLLPPGARSVKVHFA